MYLSRELVANILYAAADKARRAERVEDLAVAVEVARRAVAAGEEVLEVLAQARQVADRVERERMAVKTSKAGG